MAQITAVDRNGVRHRVETSRQASLMEILRDEGRLDIAALCGGHRVCATCHVVVAPEWVDRIPPREEEEREMIEQLQLSEARSRLACQIHFDDTLDGLEVTLIPEE